MDDIVWHLIKKAGRIVAILFAVLVFTRPIYTHSISETFVVTVDDKWTKRTPDGDDKYYVSVRPKDGSKIEVMEIDDEWTYMQWASADLYANLQRGAEHNVTVTGWRVPFLSWFRNIVRIQ